MAPVGAVAQFAQVAQRLLGRAHLPLALRELVGEADKQLAIPLPLVGGEGEDAGQVVLLGGVLLLAEVPDEVRPLVVHLAQHVEQERVHVVVERLVVQEELGEQAQVLAVELVGLAVHLPQGEVLVAVDLAPRRVPPATLRLVSPQRLPVPHVLQAKLADVQPVDLAVLVRVGGEVPGLDQVAAHLDGAHVLHFGDLLVLLLQRGHGGVR
mmetsp:Transcript_26858/g.46853  ORF Transcript_26858/g.46853 Transcript_26858/m.46853 type:complete len:210 (-) Transcript_26858:65-694(-)